MLEIPLLSNEEADYLGNKEEITVLAAAEACEALAARFAWDAIISVAELEHSPALKAESYLKLARQPLGRTHRKMLGLGSEPALFPKTTLQLGRALHPIPAP